jgi:hypothetical protein
LAEAAGGGAGCIKQKERRSENRLAEDFAAEARARQWWRRSAPGGIESFDAVEQK